MLQPSRSLIGLDVGGANLKAVHLSGPACTLAFPLWRQPDRLADALADLLPRLPPAEELAVTMTGELCDCFESKRQGVLTILAAVERVAAGRPVHVWLTDGRLVGLDAARTQPLLAAAGNWLALATWTGRLAPSGSALLLDTGSTTSDVVPLVNGKPVPVGRTDPERLRSGELVYTGATRTPLCALLGGEGAAELFATMLDVYLVLEDLPEQPDRCDTADGRPATNACAHSRLARMLGADLESSTASERLDLAWRMAARQTSLLASAIRTVSARLPGPPETVILAGSGSFLAKRAWREAAGAVDMRIVRLEEQLGQERSTAACAYALAVLAAETITSAR